MEDHMSEPVEKLLKAEEAAEFLGLKTSTIRRLTYTRELPCIRPTGRRAVRYRLRDLEALLRMRSQPMRGGER
jgi:excisionase family DNA binding protein